VSDARILLIGVDGGAIDRASTADEAVRKLDSRTYSAAIVGDAETAAQLRAHELGRSLRVVVAGVGGDPAARHGAFISTLAHDLRNPLSAIATGIELVRLKAPDPDLGRAIDRIESAAKRMAAMIDQLSELARATAGAGDAAVTQAADLGELARIAAAQVRTERAIDVAATGDVRAAVDPVRMVSAIAGVIDDAARRGPHDVRVEVRVDGADRAAVEIAIAGGAPAPAEGALDLRLYLARHAIEAHGGRFAIAASPDRGAIVTIVLPRHGL
jgi:signal transduction histidine kinase